MMALYIIAPVVLAAVILLLIKCFGYKVPSQAEREREEIEKRRRESEQLINFMQENPGQGEVIRKDFKDFLNQPHIKDLTKDVFREITKGPEDEQKENDKN